MSHMMGRGCDFQSKTTIVLLELYTLNTICTKTAQRTVNIVS